MAILTGYVTRETEAAMQFVDNSAIEIENVRPLWIPRKKIAKAVELDSPSRNIKTAQDGLRNGVPFALDVDCEWLAKVGAK